jgi:hypothetical protein
MDAWSDHRSSTSPGISLRSSCLNFWRSYRRVAPDSLGSRGFRDLGQQRISPSHCRHSPDDSRVFRGGNNRMESRRRSTPMAAERDCELHGRQSFADGIRLAADFPNALGSEAKERRIRVNLNLSSKRTEHRSGLPAGLDVILRLDSDHRGNYHRRFVRARRGFWPLHVDARKTSPNTERARRGAEWIQQSPC